MTKWGYFTPINRVITLHITGRGPPCMFVFGECNMLYIQDACVCGIDIEIQGLDSDTMGKQPG